MPEVIKSEWLSQDSNYTGVLDSLFLFHCITGLMMLLCLVSILKMLVLLPFTPSDKCLPISELFPPLKPVCVCVCMCGAGRRDVKCT